MICNPMKVIDKTGYEVILRNAEINDAEDLIQYLKITTSETPYLIREPDEVTLSLEQEQNFIQGVMDSERELMLVAIYENLGFEKYGHFPDNMKYENGKYADAYWMMKKL